MGNNNIHDPPKMFGVGLRKCIMYELRAVYINDYIC